MLPTGAFSFSKETTAMPTTMPPHCAVLCNEDRGRFYELYDALIYRYCPTDDASLFVVREITIAQWTIERHHRLITAIWDHALLAHPKGGPPDPRSIEAFIAAAETIYGRVTASTRINREIDLLHNRIAMLAKRLRYLDANFFSEKSIILDSRREQERDLHPPQPEPVPEPAPEPIQPEHPQPVANKKSAATGMPQSHPGYDDLFSEHARRPKAA
jgi:hypothetical protein